MSGHTAKPERHGAAEREAELAWAAYAALVQKEQDDPALGTNGYWRALKDTAHARFRALYESEALK